MYGAFYIKTWVSDMTLKGNKKKMFSRVYILFSRQKFG